MVRDAHPLSAAMLRIGLMAPVVPVLVIEDEADAVPLAEALVAGGLAVLEVTLRTPAALPAIERIASRTEAIVGAGTILEAADVARARDCGARFGVSPGASEALLAAAEEADLPFLPGAVTASEVIHCRDGGWTFLKFFPAEAVGGTRALAALHGPFPDVRFCPTGGITPALAPDYLALGNVVCVGGSWIAPSELVEAGAWDSIRARAAAASARAPR